MTEADTETNSGARAFIIGDLAKGLTIVVTDPVMVAHYSIEELRNGDDNLLKGTDTTNLMAALVRELVPILRGVNLDDLDRTAADFDKGNSIGTPVQTRAAFTELDFAATLGRIVQAKGSVNTVDFCIGLDIKPGDFGLGLDLDPGEIAIRWRSVSPSKDIIEYLVTNSAAGTTVPARPQVFPIDGLNVDGLDMPPKWVDPNATP